MLSEASAKVELSVQKSGQSQRERSGYSSLEMSSSSRLKEMQTMEGCFRVYE